MKKRERIINELAVLYSVPLHEFRPILDLPEAIKRCEALFSASASPAYLRDWQNNQIASAIVYYANGYYSACKESLLLAFEENISKEEWHINKLKKDALRINLEEMIDDLPNLVRFRIKQAPKISCQL